MMRGSAYAALTQMAGFVAAYAGWWAAMIAHGSAFGVGLGAMLAVVAYAAVIGVIG